MKVHSHIRCRGSLGNLGRLSSWVQECKSSCPILSFSVGLSVNTWGFNAISVKPGTCLEWLQPWQCCAVWCPSPVQNGSVCGCSDCRVYHSFMHTPASVVSQGFHLSWFILSWCRRYCCHPWIQTPKSSRISQNFQRGWLSPRCLIFRRGVNHWALSSLCLWGSKRRIDLTQGNSAAAQRRGCLPCCPQAAAMGQSLGERQVPEGPYQQGHIDGQGLLLVVPFKGCPFVFKASTSLLLGTRSVKGKSPGPLK